MLLGLSPLCIAAGILLENPLVLLLPFQAASAFFISALIYSVLRKGLAKTQGRRGLVLMLIPSYSTLLGTLVPLFNGASVLSAALVSATFASILFLKVYSALREYYVLM
uniref:Uncharacterized protein n=1 Tax=Thermofilum pendens TaxID=2269 RepID=A0A7C4B9V3_THEPE